MERARTILFQLRDFFLALPPAKRATFLGLSGGVLLATLGLVYWVQAPSYKVLYSRLDAADAGAVVDFLKSEHIPYRVNQDGGRIEVQSGRLHETRMALAARGIPQGGGVGFELFDKQTLGMTDFVQRLGYQRALQGELARTIAELSAVEAARVHLALPERSLFVAEDRNPSASVVVRLRPGRTLDSEQVDGIVHMVAGSVEGLIPGEVTVVDVHGNILSRDVQQDGRNPAQTLQAYQRELEEEYVNRIQTMLERVLGPGHAVARVSVNLDRAQVEETLENYDPDASAVRTERRSTETSSHGSAVGIPGVDSTLTNDPDAQAGQGSPVSEREDTQLSYEISRHTSRRVETVGALKRLSVAVLVDGIPSPETAGQAGDGGDAPTAAAFVPRPQEELDRYRELVKRAVGFDEDRGDEIEVISSPFHATEPIGLEGPGFLARVGDHSEFIWRVIGLIAVLIVGMFVVRPFLLAMADRAPMPEPESRVPELEGDTGANLVLPGPNTFRQGITQIARENPEEAAMVIKQWVQQGQGGAS